jgi:lipoprotein-anchoring transpeptidase ErfK/SrfK
VILFALLTSACSSLQELQATLGIQLPDFITGQAPAAAQPETAVQQGTTAAPTPPSNQPKTQLAIAEKPRTEPQPALAQLCAQPVTAGVPLKPGDKSKHVVTLQQLLNTAGFYRSKVNGIYDAQTRSAVTAFHKALDLPRNPTWRKNDWQAICAYSAPVLPKRQGKPDRVEIDLDRQLLYLIRKDQVMAIIPVSSGNGKRYQDEGGNWVKAVTPLGDYSISRFYNGWRISYLGELYRPWYFHNGFAVHGSPSVPPEPASHGCVRVPMWDADYLAQQLAVGMPIYIWKKQQG